MKNLPTTNGSEIKVKRPKKTTLRVYKPWPFRVTKITPEDRATLDGALENISGRELGAFLYTSVPSQIWLGLAAFMREKDYP